MKTGTKLLVSYALLTVVFAIVALVAYRGLTGVTRALAEVAGGHYVGSRNLAVINEAQTDVARATYGLVSPLASPERRGELLAEVESAFERMHQAWERYERRSRTSGEQQLWDALGAAWRRWEVAARAFLERTRQRDQLRSAGVPPDDPRWRSAYDSEWEQVLAMDAAYKATDPIIRRLDQVSAQVVAQVGRRGAAQGRRALAILLAGLTGGFLFTVAVGAYLAWTIAAVKRLEVWVKALEGGAPPRSAPRAGGDEVASLARAFWAMTERQREAREQLRALASRLQRVREEEKARMARDLHDQLGQLLTGLKMDLLWMEGQLETMPADRVVNTLLDRAVAAAELSDRIVEEVQRIATDLRPAALDRLGLSAALQQEARRFHERNGVPCAARTPERLPPHSSDVATALYRIAQEALTNVTRHARASAVSIRLEVGEGRLQLEIEDDGVGFDLTRRGHSLGLLGMTERAALVHGGIEFLRREPRGTTVRATVPLAVPVPPAVLTESRA